MRVVLAEDNALLRDGIVLLLVEHDIEVVASVDNAEDLLGAIAEHRPELASVHARQPLIENPSKVGYLLKDRIVGTDEFIKAARRVADGGTALDPEVIRQLLARPAVDQGLARLSEREGDILARLAEGRSNHAIAEDMHLAVRSVEKHVTAIFTKLDLAPAATDDRRLLAR